MQFRKYAIIITGLFICLFVSQSCGKGGGDDGITEQNLIINVDPNPGVAVAAALGATYDFKVLVTSLVPSGGVKIDIACIRDSDNGTVSSQSLNSNLSSTNTTVSNLQPGVLCTVKVIVTSVNKPTNTATVNFKVARK